ncbi:MAG TPA: signal peptidase I [Candidatus Angelobacter sp.]
MNAETEPKNSNEKPAKEKETLPESIAGIAAVFVSGLFILTFIIQQFEIPSRSMEQTLLVGDHVFVDRLTPTGKEGFFTSFMPYREIHRGDIAVFPSPAQPGMYLVKRIIGIPGDRIHLRNGRVFVNGVAQNEPQAIPINYPSPYRDNFPAVSPEGIPDVTEKWAEELPHNIQGGDLVVPKDHYFAMGDHREVSLDSRYWGFVPKENILGSPLFIAWSLNQTEADFPTDPSWAERVTSFIRTGIRFFGLTRWDRVMRRVH